MVDAFNAIGPSRLNPFDLFHGHVFVNEIAFGVIFHSMEYPAYSADLFPVNLGWCQKDSKVAYNEELMAKRNTLLLVPLNANEKFSSDCKLGAISLWELDIRKFSTIDASLSTESPLYTIYAESLGAGLGDVVYLGNSSKLAWSPLPAIECTN